MGIAGVVVITGASSGIGRCAAALFASQGWRVGLVARGEAGLRAARGDVEHHGCVAATARADVVDLDALDEAATSIERALGPIDVWVNCAGNGTYGRFIDTPAAEFRRSPRHPYSAALSACAGSDGDRAGRRRLPTIAGLPPRLPERGARRCAFVPRCEAAFERCAEAVPPFYAAGAGRARCFLFAPDAA